ncbi:nardilysin-like isoform X2 [Malaya genurostris]|nr:nardilysin-like isoform X2 [Malaya genurostris]XP_058457947.1 nardilysin-like isoform X2 [Malaya genurostris]XP_058457948.1 nardilysin-like isoform X2 [Malaya genurostris]
MIACFTVFARYGCSRLAPGASTLMTRKRALSPESKLVSNALFKMPARDDTYGDEESSIRYLEAPDKSFSDKKEYRSIVLPNGFHALLISDPAGRVQPARNSTSEGSNRTQSDDEASVTSSTNDLSESDGESDSDDSSGEKLAAAALSIGVGSFSDPRTVQGLAHFLEHMIFMGSDKYPAENEYDSYISKCGGFDNAVTDLEETTFYFEIDEEYLDGALDRFSSLFVSPLMNRDSICRERDAVESEFQTNINSFSSMREQLLGSLGKADHPCSLFSWGNLRTLKENVTESELYEILHRFRKRYYSAHRMHFAVQARMSLDELEDLTVKYFSSIPNNHLPGDDFSMYNERNAFKPEFFDKVFFVKPKSNICRLDVTWTLPPSVKDYKVKPVDYLSYLLGYEGKYSLTSYLRNRTLASDVQTGASYGFEKNSLLTLFSVSVTMTDKGLYNVEQILQAIYSAVRLLKKTGPVEWLYEELKEIEATSFRYRKEKDATDNVEELVVNMRYYPSKDIITGSELYFQYNASEIQDVIDNLNLPNFNIMISSSKPYKGIVYDKQEAWFGTEYAERDVPQKWKDLWNSTEIIPELQLQEQNNFISTDFTIFAEKDDSHVSRIPAFPEKILDIETCELWFRQDKVFKLPMALMYFYFISPMPLQSPKSATLSSLYTSMLKFQIAEDLYPASVAGLDYEIYASEKGIVLKVDGYNQKISIVVSEITKAMQRFDKNINPDVFEVIKKKLAKSYYNDIIKASKLNRDIRLKVVQQTFWTTLERFNELKNLTLEDLSTFSIEYFQNVTVQALIQGNFHKQDALNVMSTILTSLKIGEIQNRSLIASRAREIPLGNNYLTLKSFRDNDVNTATTNFYQAGPVTPAQNSRLELLVMLIEEPLFDILRTKEQLGYDVSTTIRDNFGVKGLSITVHSQEDKFSYQYIDEKIEFFNRKFIQILEDMPESDFKLVKSSLLKSKQIIDTSLKNEVIRNWAEITSEQYIFNRNKLEMEHIEELTKSDILKFYNQLLFDNKHRRKLSVQVVGCSEKSVPCNTGETEVVDDAEDLEREFLIHYLSTDDTQRTYITDINSFGETLKVYPVTKTKF